MGYQVNFLDNEPVTAEYLNSVSSELGGGAASFSDGMTYGVDALNAISGTLITKGVARGCGLTVSGGTVTIGDGVAFMADGRRVSIDSGGVVLGYTAGAVNYVWLYFDEVTGFVAPRCTTDAPTGSYVLLGRIAADDTIERQADVARMKNMFLGTNKTEMVTIDIAERQITSDIDGDITHTLSQDSYLSDFWLDVGVNDVEAVNYNTAARIGVVMRYDNRYVEAIW